MAEEQRPTHGDLPHGDLPPDADPTHEVLPDARSLRALAHPVRVRMLGLLREGGPATATRLAGRLGLNTGAASYHLRQLAAHGFVVEDAERGTARERWWRAAQRATSYVDEELHLGPDQRERLVEQVHQLIGAYRHDAAGGPGPGSEAGAARVVIQVQAFPERGGVDRRGVGAGDRDEDRG